MSKQGKRTPEHVRKFVQRVKLISPSLVASDIAQRVRDELGYEIDRSTVGRFIREAGLGPRSPGFPVRFHNPHPSTVSNSRGWFVKVTARMDIPQARLAVAWTIPSEPDCQLNGKYNLNWDDGLPEKYLFDGSDYIFQVVVKHGEEVGFRPVSRGGEEALYPPNTYAVEIEVYGGGKSFGLRSFVLAASSNDLEGFVLGEDW